MAELEVHIRRATRTLYDMEICHEGTHIGDYERSMKDNIPRKEREIARSTDFLLDTYAEYGKFVVRWNGKDKEIRKYQEGMADPGRPVVPLGVVIPRRYWDWA
jgi:hypothetical protein